MARIVLDTSELIAFWNRRRSRPSDQLSDGEIESMALEFVDLKKSKFIVTPVVIEFLAGAQSREELNCFKSFLGHFDVMDKGEVRKVDWERARRYAERVPRSGKPRHLGDCLVRALADRFRSIVSSLDKGFVGKR